MQNVVDPSILETLQTAQAGNANGTAIDMKGFGRLTIDVTVSTFTGTVNFEGTIDDSNWFVVGLKTNADGAAVTTATAAGAFKLPADGPALSQFRARTSGVTVGNVTVKSRKTPR